MQTPTRPKLNSEEVMTAAVAWVFPDILNWASDVGLPHVTAEGTGEFQALVTLAVIESVDGYTAGRYLDEMYDWPVDSVLVRVLDRCYATMPMLVPQLVREWVMAHAIRFPAKKGNGVKVRIGDAEFSCVVTDVHPTEARGWGEVLNAKVKGKVIAVDAEDIVKVTSTGDGTAPTPPNHPTGGTPGALTTGARLLKELRAA
jgi:hypothetical protein